MPALASHLFLGPALRTQPDRRLVALVREGYEAAFEEIVRRYGRLLGRYAASIVGGRSEDVLQDAFARALPALRRDGAEIDLRPWLFRIVRNTALNDLRDSPPSAEVLAESLAGGRNPAEELESREELADLIGRLQALPEPQRAAIVMRELEGLSHAEIAAALGLTGGGARQAIYRARRTLRDGAGMLLPLPLLRLLIDHGAEAAGAGAGGAIAAVGASAGGAGAGGALKVGVVAAVLAGSVGAGVAVQEHRDGDADAARANPTAPSPAAAASPSPPSPQLAAASIPAKDSGPDRHGAGPHRSDSDEDGGSGHVRHGPGHRGGGRFGGKHGGRGFPGRGPDRHRGHRGGRGGGRFGDRHGPRGGGPGPGRDGGRRGAGKRGDDRGSGEGRHGGHDGEGPSGGDDRGSRLGSGSGQDGGTRSGGGPGPSATPPPPEEEGSGEPGGSGDSESPEGSGEDSERSGSGSGGGGEE